jgi:hypothetical protein
MKKYDLIYFVGDSWTYAHSQFEDIDKEVTIDNRWSRLVAKHFDLEEVNNSQAGIGNLSICQRTYRDILDFISKGKKVLAVISYSDPNRVEVYNKEHSRLIALNESHWDIEFFKTYMTQYHSWEANIEQTIFYITATKTFLERYNVDYVDNFAFTKILDIPYFSNKTMLDKTLCDIAGNDGRLLEPYKNNSYGHANVQGNIRIANAIIEKLINEYFIK